MESVESFFNKAAGIRLFNFINKKFQCSCFPVRFAKFLRAPIFNNTCERLLLYLHVKCIKKIQLTMSDQRTLLKIYDGVFLRKQLTTYDFHKKGLSQILDMGLNTETVAQRCFVKKVVLQISENSQEKTCNRVS